MKCLNWSSRGGKQKLGLSGEHLRGLGSACKSKLTLGAPGWLSQLKV